MTGLRVDGTDYNVRVSADDKLARTLIEVVGPNAGTAINGRDISDTIGYKLQFAFTVQPVLGSEAQYYALFAKLHKTSGPLTVVLPFEAADVSYTCKVVSASDRYDGDPAGARWTSLSVVLRTTECVW